MHLSKIIFKLKYKLNDFFCDHYHSKINGYWFIELCLEQKPKKIYIEVYRKCTKCGNIQTKDYDLELINTYNNFYNNKVHPFYYVSIIGVRLFIDIPNTFYGEEDLWYPYYEKIKLDSSNKIITSINFDSYNRDKKITQLLDITF